MNFVKYDYWLFFPFATQVQILEYFIMKFPKRVKCSALPFYKDEGVVKEKRMFLKGLEEIPDMYEAVLQVKKNLSIFYDVLHITALDNLSDQCYGTISLYTETKNWKQDLLEECWDIVETTRRSKYFKVRHERHVLLHHERKIFIVNKNRLYKVDNKNIFNDIAQSFWIRKAHTTLAKLI